MTGSDAIIYKIAGVEEWAQAEAAEQFTGSTVDIKDGFIHFSTAAQVASTAAKHFAGRDNLVLVAVDAEALRGKIVFEEARGGMMFPHLYEPLSMQQVLWKKPMPLGSDDVHVLPDLAK